MLHQDVFVHLQKGEAVLLPQFFENDLKNRMTFMPQQENV